ncbi:MAG: hypothetical protein ACRDWA_15370 [Acidimicrobiia bacterium]
MTFTYITFMNQEERCRYVIAKDEGVTVGATGGCGHAQDSFAASWGVGTIATNGTNFGIAFGSDYESSGNERVAVEVRGLSGPLLSAPIEDGNWLVVLPLPSADATITGLRAFRGDQVVETIDTRPPHTTDPRINATP